MATPRTNVLWKLKAKESLDVLLQSPKLLFDAACRYFEWCDKHPLNRPEAVKSGAECGRIIEVPLRRPYSIMGFCAYIGCSVRYLESFKEDCDADIAETISRIEDIIANQLFEGAATGLYAASIVSKLKGEKDLASNQEASADSVLHIEVIDDKTKQQLLLLKDRLSA